MIRTPTGSMPSSPARTDVIDWTAALQRTPQAPRAFEAWLDPADFDAAGTQRRTLAEISGASPGSSAAAPY